MTSSIEPSASAALGWAVTSTAAANAVVAAFRARPNTSSATPSFFSETAAALRARSALETARVAGAARAVVIEAVMALISSPLVSFYRSA